MIVLTPKNRTKPQQKKYIADLGLPFEDKYNGSSKFRVMGDCSVLYAYHLEQDVPVITTPYSTGHEPETNITRLVNLGTYFTGVTATNFFVTQEYYNSFTQQYTRHDYAKLKENHNSEQTNNKLIGHWNLIFSNHIFCSSNLNVCYKKHNKVIVQPLSFVRSNPSGSKGIVMHYELQDVYCTASQNFQMKQNLRVIRDIMNGNENWELVDCVTKQLVEGVRIPFIGGKGTTNIFDLHHIKVVNGKSADKNGTDPAVILRTFDLKKPQNQHHIVELMKTTCLSKNTHSLVHAVPNSGIYDYDMSHRPYILQTKERFDCFCEKYNLQGLDFDQFISKLS
jgi:hypothetical protein